MKIGINAVAEQDMHALLASVQAMAPGDVLLAISYTGERREINLAAQEAAAIGADVLAFTGFTPNSLQQCATVCLYTVAEEQSTRSGHLLHQRPAGADRSAVYGAGAERSGTRLQPYSSQRGAGEKLV